MSRIILMWEDQRFRNVNLTTEQAKLCYPGLVMQEQVELLWKPDIYFDGTINGVIMKILPKHTSIRKYSLCTGGIYGQKHKA